jgi:hypothetical protein
MNRNAKEDFETASDFETSKSAAQQAAATPPPPASVPAKPAPQAEPKEAPKAILRYNWPNDLKACLALLTKADGLPTRNPREEAEKEQYLSSLRKHVFALQQGLPVIEVSAGYIAEDHQRTAPERRRQRLEALARREPLIAEFLAEFDAMAKKLAATQKWAGPNRFAG